MTISGKRVLAVVPARGGSKGLPGKNIQDLGGKPLIQWSIKSAQSSIYIDKVVVSTDNEDIAKSLEILLISLGKSLNGILTRRLNTSLFIA